MTIQELTNHEKEIILRSRWFAHAILDLTIQDWKVSIGKIDIRSYLSKYDKPKEFLVTAYELYSLDVLRKIQYGKLILNIKEGEITGIDYNSFITFKFDGILDKTFWKEYDSHDLRSTRSPAAITG